MTTPVAPGDLVLVMQGMFQGQHATIVAVDATKGTAKGKIVASWMPFAMTFKLANLRRVSA
ncbi:MAG: hypothetical protein V4510_00860 [bacterium]